MLSHKVALVILYDSDLTFQWFLLTGVGESYRLAHDLIFDADLIFHVAVHDCICFMAFLGFCSLVPIFVFAGFLHQFMCKSSIIQIQCYFSCTLLAFTYVWYLFSLSIPFTVQCKCYLKSHFDCFPFCWRVLLITVISVAVHGECYLSGCTFLFDVLSCISFMCALPRR